MKGDRLEAIRHHLYVQGLTSIQDLADAMGASVATVRRDLLTLEEQGAVGRTRGGAQIARGADIEVAFEVREKQQLAEKRSIAIAAYDLLHPHSSVFLDAGTTVLQLARLLRVDPMPLNVFTNGLIVAQTLMNVPKLRITVIGGTLRNENASMVGPAAEAELDRLWFDHLFLGMSAVGADRRMYSVDAMEARLNERMMARSAAVTVLADATKFNRRATYLVGPLAAPMRLITTAGLAAAERAGLEEAGVEVLVAEGQEVSSRFKSASEGADKP